MSVAPGPESLAAPGFVVPTKTDARQPLIGQSVGGWVDMQDEVCLAV